MRRAYLWIAAFAALPGCQALGFSGPEERWEFVRVSGVGADDLWTVVTTSLAQSGFQRLDVDRAAGTGRSGWDVSLYPYSGGGWRERAHVRLEPAGERSWRLGIRVEREKNEEVKHPLDESRAEWEADQDDAERARLLGRRVTAALAQASPAGAR